MNENDIYIFTDPDWCHPDFPGGLALFDPRNNCAALLGLRYLVSSKRGTLTLGWSVGNRQGYAACHGGLRSTNLMVHTMLLHFLAYLVQENLH